MVFLFPDIVKELLKLIIIKQVGINNGYCPSIIDRILSKKLKNKAISTVYPAIKEKPNPFKTITYSGNPSRKIKKFLNQKNINVAFKTNNSLEKYLKNSKNKTNKNNKSGVYQLTCGSCPKTYIGQTGRSLQTRITEHKRSFINNKNNSTYSNHLLENQHTFDENFKILHVENKGKKLNLLESLEIKRLKNSNLLLNDQLELNNSPLLNLFT